MHWSNPEYWWLSIPILAVLILYLWSREKRYTSPAAKHIQRAFDLVKKKSFEEAVKELDAAIALDPRAGDAYKWRALAHDEMGDYKQAIKDYTTAYEIFESTPRRSGLTADFLWLAEFSMLHVSRGDSYLNAGQHQKAVDDYNAAISRNPEIGHAYYQRAQAYLALNNNEEAKRDKAKAVELGYKPDDNRKLPT